MTDLEVLRRAKLYMDRLAQGFDPITGHELPEDSVLNQVRLTRCLFYVSDILQQVLDNGGYVGGKPKKSSFTVTPSILRLSPSTRPLRISEFAEMLAGASDDPNAKQPNTKTMTDWLLSKGFLKKQRIPTESSGGFRQKTGSTSAYIPKHGRDGRENTRRFATVERHSNSCWII